MKKLISLFALIGCVSVCEAQLSGLGNVPLTPATGGTTTIVTQQTYSLAGPINAVFDGDSITAGNYGGGAFSWVYFFTNLPYWNTNIVSSHVTAVGGSLFDASFCSGAGGNTVTNRYNTDIAYKVDGVTNVFFLFIGANDFILPNGCGGSGSLVDPDIWAANVDRLLYKTKTNGWINVVFTIMPRSQNVFGNYGDGVYDNIRGQMNYRLRYLTNADYVVDTASVLTDMRTNISYNNVIFSVDTIHPNNRGSSLIAKIADYTLKANPVRIAPPSPFGWQTQMGASISNLAIFEGTAGNNITNFGGNQLSFNLVAGGDSGAIFTTPSETGVRIQYNAGTYGGTGNTWYQYYQGGSSGRLWWGLYTGVWDDFLILTNTGDLFVKYKLKGIGGIASYTISTAMTTTATGCTNSTGINQIIYVTSATGASLTDNAGTTEFSGVTIGAFTPVRMQPGAKFVGTGVTYASGTPSHGW